MRYVTYLSVIYTNFFPTDGQSSSSNSTSYVYRNDTEEPAQAAEVPMKRRSVGPKAKAVSMKKAWLKTR